MFFYADFEAFTEEILTCKPNDKFSFTNKYQKHQPSGFCYKCVGFNTKKSVLYRAKDEIEDISQKFNKSPGHDKITARVLKDSLPVTISVITNLINRSFSSNAFAEVWKSAEVIPILKSGDFEEPSNTRPISLLPIMSKVIERAAHLQFVNYLDSHQIIANIKMEIGNFTPPRQPFYFSPMKFKKIWMPKRHL